MAEQEQSSRGTLTANGIRHYLELAGVGPSLVFVHGGFVDLEMWNPQVEHFAKNYQTVRYDLRGHGRTAPADRPKYSIELFAQDLDALLEALGIESAIICGLSLGGMIAQALAVQAPDRVRALILADTAVSTRLTLADKLQRYVLFPKGAMLLTIRLLGVKRFVDFSFWLARITRSEEWLGRNEATRNYVKRCMLRMDKDEYLKIYDAIYDFDLLNLQAIDAPTLVLNGEHESKSVLRHTEKILSLVNGSEARIVPGAGHTSNMENPQAFNVLLEDFLKRLG